MKLFFNDRFVLEEEARISILDRGLLYGDGLFETLRIRHGRPFRWTNHWERFAKSARFLRLPIPCTPDHALAALSRLTRLNRMPEAVARIVCSRGTGPRGYAPPPHPRPQFVISLHPLPPVNPAPPPWRLIIGSHRTDASNPLLSHKTCNKLLSVLHRMEAVEKKADDALALNVREEVTETTCANLFWLKGETLHTPPIEAGLLPGVTRALLMKIGKETGLEVLETGARLPALYAADGIFLTLSTLGLLAVGELEGRPIRCSPTFQALTAAYQKKLDQECPPEADYS